jgi:hypothetical protein
VRVTAPVTFGQLSVIRALPQAPGCAAEANVSRMWRCRRDVSIKELIQQVRTLAVKRASLRTVFDVEAVRPLQRVRDEVPGIDVIDVDDPGPEAPAAVRRRLHHSPFDICEDLPARFAVTMHHGRPTYVVALFHHVATDLHGLLLLEREFRALQAGRELPDAPQPADLAIAEQAATGRARRTERYWAQHWPPAGIAVPPGARRRNQRLVVSHAGARAAAEVAARTRTSVKAVMVAAACSVLAQALECERLSLSVMSGNRFRPGVRQVVTSLNQWLPMLYEPGVAEPLEALVAATYADVLAGCARSAYDIDRVEAGRAAGARLGSAPGIGVNYLGNSATFTEPSTSGPGCGEWTTGGTAARATGAVIDVSVALEAALEILVSADDSVLPPEALETVTWRMIEVVLSAAARAGGQPGDSGPRTVEASALDGRS